MKSIKHCTIIIPIEEFMRFAGRLREAGIDDPWAREREILDMAISVFTLKHGIHGITNTKTEAIIAQAVESRFPHFTEIQQQQMYVSVMQTFLVLDSFIADVIQIDKIEDVYPGNCTSWDAHIRLSIRRDSC